MGFNIKPFDSATKMIKQCRLNNRVTKQIQQINTTELAKLNISSDALALQPGKSKIPRFLYHFTSLKAYESMLKNNKIIASRKSDPIQGVFVTEINNFVRHWNNRKEWHNNDLRKCLFSQALKDDATMVVLKIPTSSMDKNKLLIRSQNTLMQLPLKQGFFNIVEKWEKTKEIPEGEFKHLFVGDKGTKSSLYNKRKEGLEYIYPNDIDLSKAEKIGEMKLEENYYDTPTRELLDKLLKNTPEAKALTAFRD